MANKSDVPTRIEKGRDIPEILHPACAECISCARKKYNKFITDSGTFYEDGFGVNCSFIPPSETFINPILKDQFKKEDWLSLNAYKSPLLWGEAYLKDPDNGQPWKAWPYQRGPLLCPSSRKCYRFGRRCLPGDMPILKADGTWTLIKDIRPGDKVVTLSENLEQKIETVLNFWENGEKEVYRIHLSNGMFIDCTFNHPFFGYREKRSDAFEKTSPEWMSLEDGLQEGMRIAVLNKYEVWGDQDNQELGRLLGYLLTDGYIVGKSQTPKFTNNSRAMIDEVKAIAKSRYGYCCTERTKGNGWDLYITDGKKETSNLLSKELEDLGLLGLKSGQKVLPSSIDSWNKSSVMALVNRMFSGDGSVAFWKKKDREHQWGCDISLTSTSYKMLDQIRLILFKIGVVSVIRKDKVPKESFHTQVWKLHISKKYDILRFLESVGPIYGKEEACKNIIDKLSLKKKCPHGIHEYVRFVSIKSVENLGKKLTYDIEVNNTHNFVSNGIYSHNTGKSSILAVEILWYLFTAGGGMIRDPLTNKIRTNLKVLLLAPQKTHVENIFDRIRAFLSVSPALGPCIDRNKRGSPQTISLVTSDGIGVGNIVSGFASGDSSGSKGLSARGQDADLVVLDEGAFISLEAIEGVVLSILYTRPSTRFIVSSTPSGIADDYFQGICQKRPDFTEFYVPATKRPDWAQIEEQMAKEFGSSQEQYDKEVLALFSPAGMGVYREDLVRLAQVDYNYGQMQPNPSFVYTFGVDWNKEHGTEIVVVGTLKSSPHASYIVHSENIPKKDNTSLRGIHRIVELNQIWKPLWIYVDAGGGDGGSALRFQGRAMVGKDILQARLKDIVKDFDFGSKIDIVEHDGLVQKVPSKPFMVENSVRKLEIGELKYPREDLNLTKQLNNYIVLRRTPAGVPIYGSKEPKWGDHTLDALNLALVAIRLEIPSFHQFGMVPLATPIAFAPNLHDPNFEPIDRIILPASAGSHSTNIYPGHKNYHGSTSVVKSWGKEPSDNDFDNGVRTRIKNARRRQYGR